MLEYFHPGSANAMAGVTISHLYFQLEVVILYRPSDVTWGW